MQRHLRLRHRADFARLRSEGKTARHTCFILSWRPSGLSENRYGFIVGRQLGNAVQRNKVRRRFREAVRAHEPGIKKGYDMAIIARRPAVDASFHDLCQGLGEVLRRARLWSEA